MSYPFDYHDTRWFFYLIIVKSKFLYDLFKLLGGRRKEWCILFRYLVYQIFWCLDILRKANSNIYIYMVSQNKCVLSWNRFYKIKIKIVVDKIRDRQFWNKVDIEIEVLRGVGQLSSGGQMINCDFSTQHEDKGYKIKNIFSHIRVSQLTIFLQL